MKATLCIRCGKERVKASEKTMVLNSSVVKITLFVCPDKDCQKKVEEQLAAKEARRQYFSNRKKPPAARK
ncbi:MAG: hypothetical protein WD187_03560 [Candidatus Woykebacteria bacterium]